jgi:hypothetical protein
MTEFDMMVKRRGLAATLRLAHALSKGRCGWVNGVDTPGIFGPFDLHRQEHAAHLCEMLSEQIRERPGKTWKLGP